MLVTKNRDFVTGSISGLVVVNSTSVGPLTRLVIVIIRPVAGSLIAASTINSPESIRLRIA